MTENYQLVMAPKMVPFARSPHQYDVAYGGRGSTKSWTFADILLARASCEKIRVLCCREVQNSIRESVHALLKEQIVRLGLQKRFRVMQESILSVTGADFLFKGLRGNKMEIKSIEGVDVCWVEEAAKVSKESWQYLLPTIRKKGSKVMVSFNPEEEKDDTYQRFVKNPPPDSLVIEVNYWENPWFYETELPKQMEYMKRVDYETYEHVWCGKPKKYSAALIFKGKIRAEDFITPDNVDRFYFGADFGFSTDPTWLGRMFIMDRKLYIDHEFYGFGVELDELHKAFHSVPGADKWKIKADSSRPDTISFLRREYKHRDGKIYPGLNIVGAEKGKGSVEDGIQFLRGFEEIIINPRCRGAKDNFENYKWKVDRITGEVLPEPAEGSDHAPDGTRYALEDLMKATGSMFVAALKHSTEPE